MTKNRKRSKTEIPFIIYCLFIPLVSFAVFYVYLNFSSILMAFQNRDGGFTLENFTRFFKEVVTPGTGFSTALRNTLLTFGINLLAYPFKVLVSFFIYKKVPFYGFYRIIFFLPSIIFGVAQAMIMQRMLAPTGPIAGMVGDFAGLSAAPELLADSRFANATVLLHMLWIQFPGDLIIWGGTFARIPDEVLESGQIDGATWWDEFTKIVVPLVWPTISLQMILLCCSIFSSSGAVFLLTNGEFGTETISSWMYKILLNGTGAGTSNAYNYMSAAGLVISAIAITISLLVRNYTDKAFNDVEY